MGKGRPFEGRGQGTMVSDQLHPGREGLRTVLLRHTLADGTWHVDWMFESRRGGELTTFRVGVRPDDPGITSFHGQRIGDHRPTYLHYEGEVGAGRGRVVRLAAGEATLLRSAERELTIVVHFGNHVRQWRGQEIGGGLWRFDATTPAEKR